MTHRTPYAPGPASAVQFYQLWSAHVDALERHLSAKMWALSAVAVLLAAYPIARIAIPVALHAAVPEVVRTVLHII